MSQDQVFADWKEREALAEKMVPLVGGLYRDQNIESSVFGRLIIKRSVIDIMKAHRFVRQVEDKELTVVDTYPVLEAVKNLNVRNAHIDYGCRTHNLDPVEYIGTKLQKKYLIISKKSSTLLQC